MDSPCRNGYTRTVERAHVFARLCAHRIDGTRVGAPTEHERSTNGGAVVARDSLGQA